MSSTPGSLALQMAKAQSAALAEFKRPLPSTNVRRRTKPKILTEERYIEEMSKIIERDFFPDLERLRAQNDYLDAESRRDYQKMAEIRARYTLGPGKGCSIINRNMARSPATFETPLNTANGGNVTPRPETLPSSQLDAVKVKNQAAIGHNMSLDAYLQHYTSEDNYSFQDIIEEAKAKLRLKYAVQYKHEQLSAEKLQHLLILPSIEQQFKPNDSSHKIETWNYTNLNSVMYMPDGVEQTTERKNSIQHKATRLPANVNLNLNLPKPKGIETRTCSYDLLRSPSPCPGKDFSPIMTWGEIDGTPFRLNGGDTPLGSSFRINENSRRENIAIALADKVSEKMRNEKQQKALNRAQGNIGSTMMRSSMDRLASMSPAARHLASSKLGLRTPKSSQLKIVPGNSKQPTPINTGSSLTDNLLKIPAKRRCEAADFL